MVDRVMRDQCDKHEIAQVRAEEITRARDPTRRPTVRPTPTPTEWREGGRNIPAALLHL